MLSTLPYKKRKYLLGDLCSSFGFCLPPDAHRRLIDDPPDDVVEFVDAVFRAESLDPTDSQHRRLREQVIERTLRYL
jgi:hypothetical protein